MNDYQMEDYLIQTILTGWDDDQILGILREELYTSVKLSTKGIGYAFLDGMDWKGVTTKQLLDSARAAGWISI